jgi:DNA-binding transcriptional ArsR family regulator
MPSSEYDRPVARASTTSDVFNAIADIHRREILDALIAGEKAVGAIVSDLSMSQPQVSKHLHERLDRSDGYLKELQQQGDLQ